MKVLTVIANPNPKSFCHAVLRELTAGLTAGRHSSEVIDLYAERFDPVFRVRDFNSYVHESMPLDVLSGMNQRQRALDTGRGPLHRFLLSRLLANKDPRAMARLAWEHRPKDVRMHQEKVARAATRSTEAREELPTDALSVRFVPGKPRHEPGLFAPGL